MVLDKALAPHRRQPNRLGGGNKADHVSRGHARRGRWHVKHERGARGLDVRGRRLDALAGEHGAAPLRDGGRIAGGSATVRGNPDRGAAVTRCRDGSQTSAEPI